MATSLVLLAPLSWLLPVRAWHPLCRALARLHMFLRGSRTLDIAEHESLRKLGLNRVRLERNFVASVYEDTLHTLRGHLPGAWKPRIVIRGREHLDRALQDGRGAILWLCPCSFAELMLKKGLHDEGFRLTNLRSHVHPYSGTRFGKRFLNPIRTRVEQRYLDGSVVLHPNKETLALRELQMKLHQNQPVSVFAIAAADRPSEVPCLGGLLRLALGAPVLAELSGAPLLPTCVLPTAQDGFEILIEAPLSSNGSLSREPTGEQLARRYATCVESWVARRPHVWRGWVSRSLWRPR
jgi:hypothetical protein